MKETAPYRRVDRDASRRAALHEAVRVRDALAGSATFCHIANGKIKSSQEIIDALTSCIAELEVLVHG